MRHAPAIDRFEVRGILGAGGVGTVYRAYDPQLDREVAIKVLGTGTSPAELASTHTIDLRAEQTPPRDDLLREARVMARLSHPNVLAVYEVGLDDSAVFFVSELVEGTNVRRWLQEPRPVSTIRAVFAQAAHGLAAAHAAGIVHRDLKPDNILVGIDGRVRVADFGMSRLVRTDGGMVRAMGEAGTPQYMAPELWRGQPATPGSDVFAFATAFVEAILGERTRKPAAEARLRERGIDARLARRVISAFADEPSARPSIVQLLDALEGHGPRWRLVLAVGVIAIAVGVTTGVATSDGPTCDLEVGSLAGRWDGPQRAALAAQYGKAPAAEADARRALAALDGYAEAIVHARQEICAARLPDRAARAQLACLDRRVIALGSLVRATRVKPRTPNGMIRSVDALLPVGDCRWALEVAAQDDLARLDALYDRSLELSRTATVSDSQGWLALARDATAAGAPELATAAEIQAGHALGLGDTKAANEVLLRAHQRANALGAPSLAATAVLERAWTAGVIGDARTQQSLAELVLANDRVSPVLQARAHAQFADGANRLNAYKAALDHVARGLEVLAAGGRPSPGVELQLLDQQLRAMRGLSIPARPLAERIVALAKQQFGASSIRYLSALQGLASLIVDEGGSIDELRAVYQQVVATVRDTTDPALKEVGVLVAATALLETEVVADAVTARDQLRALTARPITSSAVASGARNGLVSAEVTLGHFAAARAAAEKAVVATIERSGVATAATWQTQLTLIDIELELGDLASVERRLADLVETQREGKAASRAIAATAARRAALELQRKRPRTAEGIARAMLATTGEARDQAKLRRKAYAMLATSLIDQRRWADAEAALGQAFELTRAAHAPPYRIAMLELQSARILAARGEWKRARALVTGARTVLAHTPSQPRALRLANQLLAAFDRRR